MSEHTKEPIAYRLTNTAYRKPRFEYFTCKEEAERRQFDFNRSVDDGGLYDLTPLYKSEYIEQLERESSACDMVAELIKQRDELLAALEPFGATDLASPWLPAEFAMLVLRARAAVASAKGGAA